MSCLLRLSTPLKSNLRHFYPAETDCSLTVMPFRQPLPRRTHKSQSHVCAWKRVHASRCHTGQPNMTHALIVLDN